MPTASDTTSFYFERPALLALLVGCACISLLLSTGCRSTRDNQIDILERELRAQEDYIYELEDYVVEYSDKLRQCRCSQQHVAARTEPTPAPKQSTSSSTTRSKTTVDKKPSVKPLQEPRDESILDTPMPDRTPETPIEDLQVPELELEIGEPIGLEEEPNATLFANADQEQYEQTSTRGVRIPDPATYQTAAFDESEEFIEYPFNEEVIESLEESETLVEQDRPSTSGRQAEQLVITQIFRDSSESVEPSSLLTVVESRDSRNEPADFNGKVSLMVMQGEAEAPVRIKRWDFTEEETTAAWQSSQFGDGLHLELPLEATQLPTGRCELWVRLETIDGRKLLAQVPLESAALARMEDVNDGELIADNQTTGEADSESEETNPLRAGSKQKLRSTPLATAEAESKSEPQWRAATHYSTGANSGFATTASGQKWNTSPMPTSRDPQPGSSTAGKQRWTSRR